MVIMTSRRIEVLVFDAMFTLIMAKGSRKELLMKVYCDDLDFTVSPRRLNQIIKEVRETTPPTLSYTRNWIRMNKRIQARLRGLLEDQISEEDALRRHIRVLSDASLYEVPRDTREMLKCASKHFRLAIASNQEEQYLLPMLEKLKISQYFDKVVCSDQLGVAKPNLEFFQKAYEAIEVEPEAACYVGNSIRNDLPASYVGRLVLIDGDGNLKITETGGGLVQVTVIRSMRKFRHWLEEQAKVPNENPPTAIAAAG